MTSGDAWDQFNKDNESLVQAAMDAATKDEELDDVVTFLRRHERDRVLGIGLPDMADLIQALERGEHRR
jgi:hypothetical protein